MKKVTVKELQEYAENIPEELNDPGQVIHELTDMIARLDESTPPVSGSDAVPVKFAEWLLENTSMSTGNKYYVYAGQNFWTVPELYQLFNPSGKQEEQEVLWKEVHKLADECWIGGFKTKFLHTLKQSYTITRK